MPGIVAIVGCGSIGTAFAVLFAKAGFTVRADERSDHLWWELPAPWRADTFLAAASRHGIALAPAAAFTTSPAHAPHAVRIALATPSHQVLDAALGTLAELARSRPEEARELE